MYCKIISTNYSQNTTISKPKYSMLHRLCILSIKIKVVTAQINSRTR